MFNASLLIDTKKALMCGCCVLTLLFFLRRYSFLKFFRNPVFMYRMNVSQKVILVYMPFDSHTISSSAFNYTSKNETILYVFSCCTFIKFIKIYHSIWLIWGGVYFREIKGVLTF